MKRAPASLLLAAVSACVFLVSSCSTAVLPIRSINLNGAGATFPYPLYSKWFYEYNREHPEIQINYQSIGSGGGIRQVLAGTVDFGASDMPLKDEQLQEGEGGILQLPAVLGAVVPAYQLSGVSEEVRFTPEALAGIYLGTVKNWNDKELTSANPGVNLPSKPIVVVHRSDGSGTTFVWTDYLSKISEEWKSRVGANTSVQWPAGIGAKGNEGVAGLIQQIDGALGYVELIYALQNQMQFGPVMNASGKFVKADLTSATAAAASVEVMPENFRISLTNASGDESYPVASFTYLLVPKQWDDPEKKNAFLGFLNWMVERGQVIAKELNYAPLPERVQTMEKAKIQQIQ